MCYFKIRFAFVLFGSYIFWTSYPHVALSQESGLIGTPATSDATVETITNSIDMKLVRIPAGRFTMGSPASERGSQEDEVLHKVDLTKAFHLGTTEVTEHQWAMVMEEPFRTEVVEVRDPETKRLVKKEERLVKNPKLDSQLPITGISWAQAMEFCKRLGQLPQEKKEGRNYRLPTEAEWEYSCRAGTSTAYCYGDDASVLDEFAWFVGNAQDGKPMPVGQKRANKWGLYDMHGNVSEWCYDYYGDYSMDLVSDPIGPDELTSLQRVVRGKGSGKESECRSGCRSQVRDRGQPTIGFRVVLGVELPGTKVVTVINGIGQRLIKIPAGRFFMGSEKGGRSEEQPVHQVVVAKSFFIAETEVTQKEWKEVMATEPWKGKKRVTEGVDYPATYVSWEDAQEFCRRLSAMPAEKASGREYRLPTEAQWEYACRGGLTTEFNFGDDEAALADYAWFYSNKDDTPQSVRQKLPNSWGLFDMHGNVSEWCENWYDSKSYTNPSAEVRNKNERVCRGGYWVDTYFCCRSAFRSSSVSYYKKDHIGFRISFQSLR